LIFNEEGKWLPEIENCKIINSKPVDAAFKAMGLE
jgi:hypothetical protein